MTQYALSRDDNVVATLRDASSPGLDDLKATYPTSLILVVSLDITHAYQIALVFENGKECFGGIDVVFNNAGTGVSGEVEGSPRATARAVFDTNFWGAVDVSVAAVKFVREHGCS